MARMNRRQFTALAAAGAGGVLAPSRGLAADPGGEDYSADRPWMVTGKPLRVQPVLMYRVAQRREAASWRSWGPINSPEAAAEERGRIQKELAALSAESGFPLHILPLRTVTAAAEAAEVHASDYDAVLVYPASGARALLLACFASQQPKDTLIFARHQSGPVYYWYEALSTSFLSKGAPEDYAACHAGHHGPVTVHDVVIDDYGELRWRLRALYALKNFIGHRIVALGGAQGK